MKIRKIIFLIAMLGVIGLCGCSNSDNETEALKKQMEELQKQNEELSNKLDEMAQKTEVEVTDTPEVTMTPAPTSTPTPTPEPTPTCTPLPTATPKPTATPLPTPTPEKLLNELDDKIKIYGTMLDVNSAGGVSVYISWENKEEKDIKYIKFYTQLYNKVDDLLACEIRGNKQQILTQTGPIPKGKGMYTVTENAYGGTEYFKILFGGIMATEIIESDEKNEWANRKWNNVWYNSSAHYMKVVGVDIEYMDGTTYNLINQEVFDLHGIYNADEDTDYWKIPNVRGDN